jgi:hypothetical protein
MNAEDCNQQYLARNGYGGTGVARSIGILEEGRPVRRRWRGPLGRPGPAISKEAAERRHACPEVVAAAGRWL